MDENLWNLEDRFIFTDSAFQEIHWTGFVTPQATFKEMLVDVSVEGETVTYMLNQIVSTISEPMD